MKMKNLSPVFLLPPLMFMGMMPFMLATIKGMVVKAMMLNQVAFMSTLWMTVRDVVFGPRPIVKYYNYGYKPHRPPVHFRSVTRLRTLIPRNARSSLDGYRARGSHSTSGI